ncbi:MAG: hypothetical protein LBI04_02025, partial [Treponema sp.]|nr:hypothetical protein [Treponema sp.]
YDYYGWEVHYKEDKVWTAMNGFAITPEVGWKFDVGEKGKFFVSPGLKIPITIGRYTYGYWWDEQKKWGVMFGVVAYCGLGYAF